MMRSNNQQNNNTTTNAHQQHTADIPKNLSISSSSFTSTGTPPLHPKNSVTMMIKMNNKNSNNNNVNGAPPNVKQAVNTIYNPLAEEEEEEVDNEESLNTQQKQNTKPPGISPFLGSTSSAADSISSASHFQCQQQEQQQQQNQSPNQNILRSRHQQKSFSGNKSYRNSSNTGIVLASSFSNAGMGLKEASHVSLPDTPNAHEYQPLCKCHDCQAVLHEATDYSFLVTFLTRHLPWEQTIEQSFNQARTEFFERDHEHATNNSVMTVDDANKQQQQSQKLPPGAQVVNRSSTNNKNKNRRNQNKQDNNRNDDDDTEEQQQQNQQQKQLFENFRNGDQFLRHKSWEAVQETIQRKLNTNKNTNNNGNDNDNVGGSASSSSFPCTFYYHLHTMKNMTKKTRDFSLNAYLRDRNPKVLQARQEVMQNQVVFEDIHKHIETSKSVKDERKQQHHFRQQQQQQNNDEYTSQHYHQMEQLELPLPASANSNINNTSHPNQLQLQQQYQQQQQQQSAINGGSAIPTSSHAQAVSWADQHNSGANNNNSYSTSPFYTNNNQHNHHNHHHLNHVGKTAGEAAKENAKDLLRPGERLLNGHDYYRTPECVGGTRHEFLHNQHQHQHHQNSDNNNNNSYHHHHQNRNNNNRRHFNKNNKSSVIHAPTNSPALSFSTAPTTQQQVAQYQQYQQQQQQQQQYQQQQYNYYQHQYHQYASGCDVNAATTAASLYYPSPSVHQYHHQQSFNNNSMNAFVNGLAWINNNVVGGQTTSAGYTEY